MSTDDMRSSISQLKLGGYLERDKSSRGRIAHYRITPMGLRAADEISPKNINLTPQPRLCNSASRDPLNPLLHLGMGRVGLARYA